MNALKIIKEKGDNFNGEKLCYLIGKCKGRFVGEINGSDSYCPKCIDSIIKGMQDKLDKIGFKEFQKIYDCPESLIDEIGYGVESMPESDDFCTCENCECELQVGVLFTFSQEIDHWIEQAKSNNIDLNALSDSDAYRINGCITSEDALEKHPKEVKELYSLLINLK